MSTIPTPDTPENWDAASRGYATKVAPFLMRSFTEAIVERLNADANAKILEVGAGSGALTEVLYPRVGSLLATDFAPKMIEVLQERMETAGATNVQFKVMDGQALDLEDDSFDAAASSFAIMLFPDRVKGFSELCRVLRPGGRAAVSGWAGPDRFELFKFIISAMRKAFPDMPPPPSPPPVFNLADPDKFKSEMEAGGFRDVEVDFVARDLEIENFDGLWGMATTGAPPVKILLDRVGPEGQTRLHDCLKEIIEAQFGNGPIKMTNVATLASGVAP